MASHAWPLVFIFEGFIVTVRAHCIMRRSFPLCALLIAFVIGALLTGAADAKRRRRAKRDRAQPHAAREADVGAQGAFSFGDEDEDGGDDDLTGFAAPPPAAGRGGGGGTDMSHEFKKYRTCESCVGAGWGWCPIRRMCGGFANKHCTGTESDLAEGEAEPAAAAVGSWRNTALTTRLWEIIRDADSEALREVLDETPDAHLARSADGRGPLFWAHEFARSDMVQQLLQRGADASARDAQGKRPADVASGATTGTAAPRAQPRGTDMRAEFAKYRDCQSCVGAGWGWCPIRRMCGGFANKHCSGTESDRA